jgi:thiamine transporter ThiT
MTDNSDANKPFSLHRWASVLLRTAHIAGMGVVLGGVFLGAHHEALATAIWATILSGLLMMLMDLLKDPWYLLQGSGLMLALKLTMLAVGFYLLPEQRFAWYLAATAVASIGSHMPGRLRHFCLLGKSKR